MRTSRFRELLLVDFSHLLPGLATNCWRLTAESHNGEVVWLAVPAAGFVIYAQRRSEFCSCGNSAGLQSRFHRCGFRSTLPSDRHTDDLVAFQENIH